MWDMAANNPIDRDEFADIVRRHTRWLETGGGDARWEHFDANGLVLAVHVGSAGHEGVQAVLRGRRLGPELDLRGLVLPFANLTGVVAEGVDLSGADLHGSSVTDAYLAGVD